MFASPMRKGIPIRWSNACKASFKELKQRLVTDPVLTVPESSEEYAINNGASKK